MWGWRRGDSGRRKTRRRKLFEQFGWQRSEDLETRYLLSAAGHHHGAGQVQVETEAASEPRKKPHESKFLDVSGTWNYVLHTDGVDIPGILVLQQHGKKVTGTLTHDQQPPGEVKLKLVKSKHKDDSQHFNGSIQDFSEDSDDEDTDGDFDDEDHDGVADRGDGEYEDEEDGSTWSAER